MKRFTLLLLVLGFFGGSDLVLARSKRSVPLMPSRYSSQVAYASPQRSNRMESSGRAYREPLKFGLEVGFQGRQNSTEGKALGMEWMKGLRLSVDYHWLSRWHLKPSFGYFTRNDGEAMSELTEHQFDLGLAALYDLFPSRTSSLYVGAVGRMDALFATVKLLNSTDSIPFAFRFRAGPAAHIHIGVSRQTSLMLNLEAPFEMFELRPFGSATLGVMTSF